MEPPVASNFIIAFAIIIIIILHWSCLYDVRSTDFHRCCRSTRRFHSAFRTKKFTHWWWQKKISTIFTCFCLSFSFFLFVSVMSHVRIIFFSWSDVIWWWLYTYASICLCLCVYRWVYTIFNKRLFSLIWCYWLNVTSWNAQHIFDFFLSSLLMFRYVKHSIKSTKSFFVGIFFG